jgi:hypothetical protein
MFEFCHHCGQTIGQEQVVGQTLVCKHCGGEIGVVKAPPRKIVIDAREEWIRRGDAARCPLCQQIVELKKRGAARSYVPHRAVAGPSKMCPNSGKEIKPDAAPAAPAAKPSGGKDLGAYMTRDQVKVVSCRKGAAPRIEELKLEYLDKSDRVRLQIEALRSILGPTFRMAPYPPSLNRPHLAVWSNAAACVVARKHDQGGYQRLDDVEVMQVVDDLRRQAGMFFG